MEISSGWDMTGYPGPGGLGSAGWACEWLRHKAAVLLLMSTRMGNKEYSFPPLCGAAQVAATLRRSIIITLKY